MPDTSDVLDVIAKGLSASGVLEDWASGEDLSDILPAETVEVLAKTLSAVSADPRGEAAMDDDFDFSALPEPVQSYIADLEKRAAEVTPPSDEDLITEVLKGIDPAVAEVIKADRARLAETEERLRAAEEEKAQAEFAKRAARFEGVAEDNRELAAVLRKVYETDAEAGQTLEKILGTASNRIMKGALLTELGTSYSGGESDAFGRATQIAKSWVSEGKYESVEEARAAVWENDSDLYQQYQAERSAR
jgi:hypothetical protein